jgi:hypothetical protein
MAKIAQDAGIERRKLRFVTRGLITENALPLVHEAGELE